jgi:hypothetical protein
MLKINKNKGLTLYLVHCSAATQRLLSSDVRLAGYF